MQIFALLFAGLDLNSIGEASETHSPSSSAGDLGSGHNPPMSPSVASLMGQGSPLVRGMSGSGLARLHRVGSIPLSDMNRHSLSQVSNA